MLVMKNAGSVNDISVYFNFKHQIQLLTTHEEIPTVTAGLRVSQLGSLRRQFSFEHAHRWPLM